MKDLDKAKGVIFGLSIGDALCWPTEFMTLPKIKAKFWPDGITELQESAIFTDDTQMSIAIAEALIRTGEKDIAPIKDSVKTGLAASSVTLNANIDPAAKFWSAAIGKF